MKGGVRIAGLTGIVSVTNSSFENAASGLDLISLASAGTLDVTIQNNMFTDLYKEFACTGTVNVGRRGVSIQAEGSHNVVARIGDPAQVNSSLGNTFTNNLTASIVVNSQEGGGTPHTGLIETVISQNIFRVTDHLTGPSSCASGSLVFNFPQGGVSLNPGNTASYEALVTNNVFDQVMHAAGGLGQLTLGLNGGTADVIVRGNEFGLPWDAALQIRAEGGADARVLVETNTWPDGMVGGPGDDVGLPTQSPFQGVIVDVSNDADLDLTVRGEIGPFQLPEHDTVLGPRPQTVTVEVQSQAGTSLDLYMDNNDAPNGYRLNNPSGVRPFRLYREVTGSTTAAAAMAANGNVGTVVDTNITLSDVLPVLPSVSIP